MEKIFIPAYFYAMLMMLFGHESVFILMTSTLMLIYVIYIIIFRNTNEEYKDPFMTARVLYWMGDQEESERTFRHLLQDTPDHWKARQELVLLLHRMNRIDEAVIEAQEMVKNCPWRAESYDTLSYILKEVGDKKLSIEVKERGNAIFKKEMILFDRIKKK